MAIVLFNTTQISGFNTTALNSLSTAVINALSPVQAQALNTTQIASLNTTQLTALNSSSASAFSTTQVAALSTTQLAALVIPTGPSSQPAFPQTMGLPAVIVTASNGQNYTQIANMSVLDVGGPNGSQYSHISAYPLGTLATAQQTQLFKSPDGVKVFPISCPSMPAYTSTTIGALAPTVFTHIDGSAISESNPLKIDHGEQLLVADAAPPAAGVAHIAQRMGY